MTEAGGLQAKGDLKVRELDHGNSRGILVAIEGVPNTTARYLLDPNPHDHGRYNKEHVKFYNQVGGQLLDHYNANGHTWPGTPWQTGVIKVAGIAFTLEAWPWS